MSWNTDIMLEPAIHGGGTLFGGFFHKAIARPVFQFAGTLGVFSVRQS